MAGCYAIHIARNTDVPSQVWHKSEFYGFGIQVRTWTTPGRHVPTEIAGCGQTVFAVRELGN